jgi:hypothetical protein
MNSKKDQLSIIVFSKDRPLQLQGYLESLLHFSDISLNNIFVIYKDSNIISYDKIVTDFKNINWIKEGNFFDDLQNVIIGSSTFLMFGCDDVIFKAEINLTQALEKLESSNEIFGFSLRLGMNIKPYNDQAVLSESFITWNWKNSKLDSWNYPWELDSTIYRKADVQEILAKLSSLQIRNPNYLESEIAQNSMLYIKRDFLASFKLSKAIVLTVNRVQDSFKNDFDNSLPTDISNLYKLYIEGGRLDYLAIANKPNKKIHVGAQYFIIKGSQSKFNRPMMFLKIFIKKICNQFKRIKL